MSDGGRPSFFKVAGAGNDFILVDARKAVPGLDPVPWARRLCARRVAVGSDGLLVVERSSRAALRLTMFNPDGSQAFCGNGTLCVARWGREVAGLPAEMAIETDEGVIATRVDGHLVEMQVPPPREVRAGVSLAVVGRDDSGVFVDVGCPHLVAIGPRLPDDAVFTALAPILRRHPELGAAGANVDFVQVEDPHHLRLRIFERGVEDETLSSGTGCLAAALAAATEGVAQSPVSCRTRGGDILEVAFHRDGGAFADVRLTGSTALLYRGTLGPDLVP